MLTFDRSLIISYLTTLVVWQPTDRAGPVSLIDIQNVNDHVNTDVKHLVRREGVGEFASIAYY